MAEICWGKRWILLWVFYDTIGGNGPTGADIGGSGANWGEEMGAVDWMVDCEDIPDTDVEDDAVNRNISIKKTKY